MADMMVQKRRRRKSRSNNNVMRNWFPNRSVQLSRMAGLMLKKEKKTESWS
jgi:hypothetical protein